MSLPEYSSDEEAVLTLKLNYSNARGSSPELIKDLKDVLQRAGWKITESIIPTNASSDTAETYTFQRASDPTGSWVQAFWKD